MPEAWTPSEKVEVVFCITRKCVHYQCRKGNENSCNHKNFHQERKSPMTVVHTTLQTVADDTVDQSCVEIPNFQTKSLAT